MPQVSVLLPAFNAARTIRRAVDSILTQTFGDLELIVVDDGSTDRTVARVEESGDARLNVVRQRHGGVASAANLALERATAPLVARMDADDVSHPRRIERQVEWLRAYDLDAVGCQVRIVDGDGRLVESLQRYQRWINSETLDSDEIAALRFVELPLVNPTILAKRAYFELGCRDDDLPEDYDLLLRAARLGMRFGKVPEVLFDWVDSGDRLTRTDPRYTDDAFMRCRRQHLLDGPLAGVDAVDLWGLGQTGKPWIAWLQSHGIGVRSGYDVNRRKIGERIHGVEVRHCDEMPAADGTLIIIAVGAEGARELIRPHLAERGYVAGRDAWFVA